MPAWISRIGGKRIPLAAMIIPAALGGLVMTFFLVGLVLSFCHVGLARVHYTNLGWNLLLGLWGPLLLVVTFGYYRRRCGRA